MALALSSYATPPVDISPDHSLDDSDGNLSAFDDPLGDTAEKPLGVFQVAVMADEERVRIR